VACRFCWPVGCANSVAPAKRSNLTSGPYARRSGRRLAIASEPPPIDKDKEPWRRDGCGLSAERTVDARVSVRRVNRARPTDFAAGPELTHPTRPRLGVKDQRRSREARSGSAPSDTHPRPEKLENISASSQLHEAAVGRIFREEPDRSIAALIRAFGDIDLAPDIVSGFAAP
jgi:hypothetical protein